MTRETSAFIQYIVCNSCVRFQGRGTMTDY